MATIRELVIKLRAKGAGQAARELGKMGRAEEKVAESTNKVAKANRSRASALTQYVRASTRSYKSITGLAKTAAMALGMLVGVQGILVARAALWGEEITRLATGFQMSIGQAQEMREAFLVLGGTTDDLADALGTMADRGLDAVEGSKTYQKEFKRVGFTMDEVKAKLKEGPVALFEAFINKTTKLADRTQALAAAVRLFGDDLGRRLVPILVEGGESFQQIITLARKFGLVLEDSAVKKLKALMIEFRKVQFFVTGLGRKLASELADPILAISDDINQWIGGLDKVTKSRMGEWATMLGETIEKLRIYWTAFYKAIGGDKTLDKALHIFTQLTPVIILLGGGFAALAGSTLVVTLLSKMTAVGAALAAVVGFMVLAFEDLTGYLNGVPSLLGLLAERFPPVKDALDAVTQAMSYAKVAIGVLVKEFKLLLVQMGIEGPDGLSIFESAVISIVKAFLTFVRIVLYVVAGISALVAGVMRVVSTFIRLKRAIDEVGYAFKKNVIDLLGHPILQNSPFGAIAEAGRQVVQGQFEDAGFGIPLDISGVNPLKVGPGNMWEADRQRKANQEYRKKQLSGSMFRAAGSLTPGTNLVQSTMMQGSWGSGSQAAAYGGANGALAGLASANQLGAAPITIMINGDVTEKNAVELARKAGAEVFNRQRAANAAQAGGAR